jgi:hypothetical protein
LGFSQKFVLISGMNCYIQHFESGIAVEVAMFAKIDLGATPLPQQFDKLVVAKMLSHTICHGLLRLCF